MTHRIQLSTDTRALLLEAFPSGRGGGELRHHELSRTARAARELLWTSHREELGYCAAAQAYLMEFDSEQFKGLSYSAPNHADHTSRATSVIDRSPGSDSSLTIIGACRLAFELVPNGSSKIRLGVALRRLDLIGSRADWDSAYCGSVAHDLLVAGSAQNAGLVAGSLGRFELALDHYLEAYELAGNPGDLLLAWVLASHVGQTTRSLPSLDSDLVDALGTGAVLSGAAAACSKFRIPTASWLISAQQGDMDPITKLFVQPSAKRGQS